MKLQLLFLVATAATAVADPSALRGRSLMGSMPDLSAMGLPFKKDAVMNILSSGNCDVSKLLALVPAVQELGTKLGEIKSPADAEPLLEKYGNQALGALCAGSGACPNAIVGELDPAKLPAGLSAAAIAQIAGKMCLQNDARAGYCLVEAAEDALATAVLAGAAAAPADLPAAVAGGVGAATICKSGCYAKMTKDFLVQMKALVESLVGQALDAPYADVAAMCGNTGGGGNTGGAGSGGTGAPTAGGGGGKGGTGGTGDTPKGKDGTPSKGVTDEKWFLPAVVGGGCALVAALAFAAVCLTRRARKAGRRGDPEGVKAPLTPRGGAQETGAPVAQRV